MKLILLAPPAAGKGTVAAKLAKEFRLHHISAGQLLREEANCGSTTGKKIKAIIDKGDLVPDDLVIEIVKLVVQGKDNYILDGFPRTIHQAKDIKDLGINKVIYLKISENTAVERISGRRVCEKKGHTYHIKYIAPKQEGVCDIDGSKLIQRKDDTEEVIRERFKVYNEKTQPLINYYKNEGLLVTVDGTPLPDEVYASVKEVVK
jgi:adenylate kinase